MFFPFARNRILVGIALLGGLDLLQAGRPSNQGASGLTFLQPWFDVTREDRDRLARRGVVVRGLSARERQIAVIGVCAVAVSPDEFVARARSVGDVKRSSRPAGRFADPPALDDLAELALDPGDVERLGRCRPGSCALNLSSGEMSALQAAFRKESQGPSIEGQQAFRRVVLERVRLYRARGLDAVPEYHDRPEPVRPAAVFSHIVQQSPYLADHVPDVSDYLQQFPRRDHDRADSFLQWAKVIINGKPVVMVDHVSILRPKPGPRVPTALLAAKQVYASRYMNGELMLMMLFADAGGSGHYLVHVVRSDLDELVGRFSGLKRAVMEHRIKDEAVHALAALRDRFERRP